MDPTKPSQDTAQDFQLRPDRLRLDSIRLQLSLVLLLSALNGIVLVSAAAALFSAVARGPDTTQLTQFHDAIASITALHVAALDPEEGDEGGEEDARDLELLEGQIEKLPGGSDGARAIWEYRQVLASWRSKGRTPESDAALTSAYYKAVGALDEPLREGPTHWISRSINGLAWVMAWVVLVAVTTVLAAVRLRGVLSKPLRRLSGAAAAVASGNLDHPFDEPGSSHEIQELAGALESMRRELVELIDRHERQNVVMKAMLDSLSDGVLFLDGNARIVRYNPRAETILTAVGLPRGALHAGVDARRLVPGAPDDLLITATGEPIPLSFDRPRGRLHLRVTVNRVVYLDQEGTRAWVVALRDVTSAVEAENIKRDFLSVVTHELKTPLTVIEGYVRLLLLGKGGDITAKQARLLEMVREQSQLLNRMVQDLLDTTRIEGGNLQIEPIPVDLNRLVTEVAEQFAVTALAQKVRLDLEPPGPAVRCVVVDTFRIQQVLSNLIRNAFKFTPEGGSVTLTVHTEGERAAVSVTDTGRGIPAEAIPHLFQKFYQVERGDTRKAGGAGLGLYICDQLVRMMGGRIRVESQEGRGSRFTVSFPLVEQQPEPARAGLGGTT